MDGDTYFFYDRNEVIEERDRSENILQQYVYGTQHIDELVMVRGGNGTFFVYQDPNWNVIALTTPGRNGGTGETPTLPPTVAEEARYTPYGRATFARHRAFGDQDGDGDQNGIDDACP